MKKFFVIVFLVLFLLAAPSMLKAQHNFWDLFGKGYPYYDDYHYPQYPYPQIHDESADNDSRSIAADEAEEVFTDRGLLISLDGSSSTHIAEISVYDAHENFRLEKKVCIRVSKNDEFRVATKCSTSSNLGRAAKGAAKELFKVKAFKQEVKILYLKRD